MRGFAVLVLALLVCSAWRSDVRADEDVQSAPDVPPNDDELGPLIQIEAIVIRGNTATQDEIIRRALPIAPGDVLKASDRRLRDARFKVLALGFFRDVELAMHKGSQRGLVIIQIDVIERGTFVLNKLWFGRSALTPYWVGVDVGERNLLGLGISAGVGAIYAAPSDVDGSRAQWATEMRVADGSLLGTRWGANGSLTLVHGSDTYRITGDDDDDDLSNFRGFGYRRFGGRFGTTYDITALARLSGQFRIESVNAELPDAPTRVLPTAERSSSICGFSRARAASSPPASGSIATPARTRSFRTRAGASQRWSSSAPPRSRATTTSRPCSPGTSTGGHCATNAIRLGFASAAVSLSAMLPASIVSSCPTSTACSRRARSASSCRTRLRSTF